MSTKALLPQPLIGPNIPSRRQKPKALLTLLALCLVSLTCTFYWHGYSSKAWSRTQSIPLDAHEILTRCAALKAKPGPPYNFMERSESDRFEEGTPATIIRNAAIWTGEKNGTEIIHGDLLLDKGIIQAIGEVQRTPVNEARIIDARGAWVTPGLSTRCFFCKVTVFMPVAPFPVDLHSHVGIYSLPTLRGTRLSV
jgi:hypothetical protein